MDPVYAETRDIRLLGFVFFLLADCVLFGAFVFAYLYLRTAAPVWPPIVDGKQIERLDVAFGAMNSIVLFGSGVTMHFALESWKHLKKAAFNFWIVATIVLGIGFLLGQSHKYMSAADDLAGQHLRGIVLHPDGLARLPRLRRRLFPDGAGDSSQPRRLHGLEVLRSRRRHAVLALRRRHLGPALLPVLSLVMVKQ